MNQIDFKQPHDIITEAAQQGVEATQYALDNGYKSHLGIQALWRLPVDMDDRSIEYSRTGELWAAATTGEDPLSKYVIEQCNNIQFPVATAYLCGLGMIASAMIRNFTYNYYGEQTPVNLYVVTAQPPSSGKSAIVKGFQKPIRDAYQSLNVEHLKLRKPLESQIKALEKDISNASTDEEAEQLGIELDEAIQKLAEYPIYKYAMDDATPEAVGDIALTQGGLFNIISDESDAVNTILGTTYGGKDKTANHSVFLKGWDCEHYSPARITRKTKEGEIRGCFVVCAQTEAIVNILQAGMSGRGISERLLLLNEENMLGKREHTTKRRTADPAIKEAYCQLVHNIVHSKPVALEFSEEALELMIEKKQHYEPLMADGAEYSHSLLTGVIGKMDKQVSKLASILHVSSQWHLPVNRRSEVISADTMQLALLLFDRLKETYVDAADRFNFAGETTFLMILIQRLQKYVGKGKYHIQIRQLRDAIKTHKSLTGISNLTKTMRDDWLPELKRMNYIVYDDKTIWINPHLTGE